MKLYKLLTIVLMTFLSFFNSGYAQVQVEDGNDSIRSINGKMIKVKNLDNFLKAQIDSLNIPGLSFAYINGDKVVYNKNLGVKNTLTQEPVDDETLFDAASISKTVFSFFTLQMVDRGLLKLDIPLYKYLENPDIAHDERYKKITARMALSHTTGFPNWRYLSDNGYDPNGKLRIEFEPGTQYQYSGEGFQYVAEVIAHLLGTDMNGLQKIIKEQLFRPLKMGSSSFVWNAYLELHRADGHANGEPNSGWSTNSKNPNFNAAASLQTNAKYYANFLVDLMYGNLISKASQMEMLKVQSTRLESKNRPGVQYGLGIIIDQSDFGTNYAHSGDNGSATSQFLFNKENRSGYVFFANVDNKIMQTFHSRLQEFLLYE